ncbi:MAG: DUF979 domain-containing protein [Lactobacillus delbrueckii]|nr:DUF979 domain-containing protein [Lactobacillus delbrueckii]MCI1707398.1 DUF979 domain-containing protein [Lactobacillus delbrueckii]MCI1790011.1 DUF979 domain-containing protein [Lactobacillus delbrueckii]
MKNLLLALYILVGIVLLVAGIESFRDKKNPAHVGTGLFWIIMAVIFAFGDMLPSVVSGILVVIMGLLAFFKQIKIGNIPEVNEQRAEKSAKRLGWWVFLPSVILAVIAFYISQYTKLGGQIGIGIASIVSLIVAWIETRSSAKDVYFDTHRSIRAMGTAGVLPQLLAMLGAVFTAAGIGKLTAQIIAGIFPAGNHLLGVALYCIAMAIFTIIMGNAFAAFAVITTAIGIPFVVAQGGNPAVVAALGMTAGYCGTLLTPMAANFNSLPVALLDMKDETGVIKAQAPVAIVMLLVHIVLMYFLAF